MVILTLAMVETGFARVVENGSSTRMGTLAID